MSEMEQTPSQQRHNQLAEVLGAAFSDQNCEVIQRLNEVTLVVPCEQLTSIAMTLRDDDRFGFDTLIDVCGVDYSLYGESEWATTSTSATGYGRGVEHARVTPGEGATRFAAVYHLLSVANNQRLRVRTFVDSDFPVVDSVVGIWSAADWFEREAFDLYGILFEGHPDLRRILTDYGFMGHPFRKDFPVEGEVEMRYDPEKQRVVYEPVSIDPRMLIPKVIREDNRYMEESSAEQGEADA